jgi:hypothetical protein
MSRESRCDAHTLATAGESPEDLNRALWRALVEALTLFLREARRQLGMKRGEKCPRCGHAF